MKIRTELKLRYIKRILSYPLFTRFNYDGKRITRIKALKLGLKEIDKYFLFDDNN